MDTAAERDDLPGELVGVDPWSFRFIVGANIDAVDGWRKYRIEGSHHGEDYDTGQH